MLDEIILDLVAMILVSTIVNMEEQKQLLMYGMGWKPGMSANGFLNVALENGYGFIYSIEKGHYVYKTIYGFVASKKIISKEFFDDEGNYTNSGFISHSGVIGLIPDAMYRFKNDNGGEGLFSMSVGYSGSAYDC